MNNDLVIRFIERQCTIEEAREVLRWIEATEENKAVFCQMQAVHASIGIDHSDRTEKVSPEDVRKIMKEILVNMKKSWPELKIKKRLL